jgi:hypothetical protein
MENYVAKSAIHGGLGLEDRRNSKIRHLDAKKQELW